MLQGVGRRDASLPLLKDLHWLSISFRAQFKGLVALNELGPRYLQDHLLQYQPTQESETTDRCTTLPTAQCCYSLQILCLCSHAATTFIILLAYLPLSQ